MRFKQGDFALIKVDSEGRPIPVIIHRVGFSRYRLRSRWTTEEEAERPGHDQGFIWNDGDLCTEEEALKMVMCS